VIDYLLLSIVFGDARTLTPHGLHLKVLDTSSSSMNFE
jgi:hypothetical protein